MSTRTKHKKILEEIHPLNIIREVQKWPVLWSKDTTEPASFKNQIWKEICKVLFVSWDSYSESEKECKVADIIKRWRNLRDTFKRQLTVEQKIREGHNIRKRTYVYFKHMLFLLPHLIEAEAEQPEPVSEPCLEEYFKRSKKRSNKDKQSKKRKVIIETVSPEETIDEDKHFLMSLIPSFKSMSDDEKLTAKVEILKVIKDIKASSAASAVDSLSYPGDDMSDMKIRVETIKSEADLNSGSESDWGPS